MYGVQTVNFYALDWQSFIVTISILIPPLNQAKVRLIVFYINPYARYWTIFFIFIFRTNNLDYSSWGFAYIQTSRIPELKPILLITVSLPVGNTINIDQ